MVENGDKFLHTMFEISG